MTQRRPPVRLNAFRFKGSRSMKLMRVEYVADRVLGVTRARLYQLIRDGIVPAVRLGRSIRIEENALRQFIARGGASAPCSARQTAACEGNSGTIRED